MDKLKMNFLELLLLIEESGEKVLASHQREIITPTKRFFKLVDTWEQDKNPGSPVEMAGRGGKFWVWQTKMDDEVLSSK
jgi:hypothetical protein